LADRFVEDRYGPKAKLNHFGDLAGDLDFEAISRGPYRNMLN